MTYIPPTAAVLLDANGTPEGVYPNRRQLLAGNNVNFNDTGAAGSVTAQVDKITTSTSTPVTLTTSSNYALYISDAGGSAVVNLPVASSSSEKRYLIKKTNSSANTVTITPNGADTIEGAATLVLSTQYSYYEIQSDGTASWKIISQSASGGANSLGSYIVVSSTNAPTNYRTLTGGKNVFTTDGGAAGAFTLETEAFTSISSVTTLTATSNTNQTCDATSAAFAVTLPAASNSPKKFTIVKTDSSANAVTVTAAGSDTIDGAATYVLTLQYYAITLLAIGSNKWIIL